MSDAWMLVAIALIAALLAHTARRDYLLACTLSATATAGAIGAVMLVREHFPVGIIANAPFLLFTAGVPAFAIAAIVGYPVHLLRRRNHQPPSDNEHTA